MDQPLVPFTSPLAVAAQYGLSAHQLGAGLVLLGLFFWLLFTLTAIYHWLRYSHAALLSLPSVAAHLFVSGVLILFTLDALASL
ncbi:MAG TPA: hypothetical protein VHC68_03210 [Candidatus Paceibacterota bacterium]|nr:hypothetical protein [Candidatus Paceibacterota bacterium]